MTWNNWTKTGKYPEWFSSWT